VTFWSNHADSYKMMRDGENGRWAAWPIPGPCCCAGTPPAPWISPSTRGIFLGFRTGSCPRAIPAAPGVWKLISATLEARPAQIELLKQTGNGPVNPAGFAIDHARNWRR